MNKVTRTTRACTIETRYTNRNKTGIMFIVVSSEPDGQQFRYAIQKGDSEKAKFHLTDDFQCNG